MSNSKLFKFLSEDGFIRASCVVYTDVLNELRELQETSPVSTMALGRTLVGAILLSSRLKDEQAVAIQIQCEGSMAMVFAQSSYECGVRAFVGEPHLPMSVDRGNLFLAPHVGEGTLTVSTYIKGSAQPQISRVALQTGEITEDLAHYLRTSLQVPCLITSGILLGTEGVVTSAGGLMVEMLPGHTEDHIALVERCLKAMGSISDVLANQPTGEDILRMFFLGVKGQIWEHPHALQISCSCNRDKVTSSIELLGEVDVKDMIAKNEMVQVKCEMCGRRYVVVMDDLKAIYQRLRKLH
ncbi:MAG: Hsp33 family molecular chaperone HslO [Bdellovibrionaceae bacterium]|nr:Hsp33 family molecular chaperone HslO [Pseudobdellovibrionaceae bacterium]